jgi:hypothetical protein
MDTVPTNDNAPFITLLIVLGTIFIIGVINLIFMIMCDCVEREIGIRFIHDDVSNNEKDAW